MCHVFIKDKNTNGIYIHIYESSFDEQLTKKINIQMKNNNVTIHVKKIELNWSIKSNYHLNNLITKWRPIK
jgi:hypothetical protein